jgi:hypothetical protein
MAGKPNSNINPSTGRSPADDDASSIRDSSEVAAYDKRAKTADAMNPVPRATGPVPAKPTRARENF